MAWKYVVVRVGNTEVPIMFPSRLVHVMVLEAIKDLFVAEAKMFAPMLSEGAVKTLRDGITAASAGDCELLVLSTSGSSETLNIKSRPDDKDAINTNPYTGGMV